MIDKERATLGHECRHGRSSASATRIAPFPHVFQISLADVKDKLGKGELASWIRPTNRSALQIETYQT
ncbi:MAG: hypothetical protein QOJ42_6892 [Acidobacteriaceae bacterium]|nr:hypothetical protein [Acidobacteriaceae bacterium]